MARPDYRTLGVTVPVTDVLDPKLWRERYAFGISLGEPTNQRRTLDARIKACLARQSAGCGPDTAQDALDDIITGIPDDVIRWHLRAALSDLELKLGLKMGIQVVKSDPVDDGLVLGRDYDRLRGRLPYTHGEALTWFRVDLADNSIISVERVRGFYYGTQVWDISETKGNNDLIRLEWSKQGVLHILPINLQSIAVTQGGNYGIWQTIHLHRSPIPDFWAIDYTTGPVAHNGEVGKIEAVLAHWCYCAAGITLLSIGGLAQSKGLSSSSVSMDGVSRSVGLQASAIYGINSALENVYNETLKRIDWKRLRTHKRGLRLKMYSY